MKLQVLGAVAVAASVGITAAVADSNPAQIAPKFYSVLATASVQTNPPLVTLQWPQDTNATAYAVARKGIEEANWLSLTSLEGNATNFIDAAVAMSTAYEYQIVKTTPKLVGYGYLRVGLAAPLIDQRGKIILLVAQTYAADLAPELDQLQQDLVGDGWTVIRHDVSPDAPVTTVKALVQADYDADPANVRALFLFGRVPVPYSGDISPDGHPNHQGAWPADVYYGDLHGLWTDSSVTSTNAERSRNWNVPGDGKFDQSSPTNVDLQIGRVDLSNMTCFSNKIPSRDERDLLRQYLVKDHRFRHKQLPVESRALICDNFFDKGDDPIGGSGWRNFAGFFGPEGIVEVGWSNYFPAVTSGSYLWTFASGGGQFYTSTGVGSSDDFALQDVQVVFTLWLGSYFGDWDTESNFLRAPLGSSSYTLTSVYAGFPQWLFHPMALGQTAGYCAQLTQNNRQRGRYPPHNTGAGQVHIALLGDPTLRMHPVAPPTNVTATLTARGVRLSWSPSPEPDLVGYHVYRALSASGPFARITTTPAGTNTTFNDTPPAGTYTYMVRAVKLQHSSSGTYLNPSQAAFSAAISTTPEGGALPLLSIARPSAGHIELRLAGDPGQSFTVQVSSDFVNWQDLTFGQLKTNALELIEPVALELPERFYRVQ